MEINKEEFFSETKAIVADALEGKSKEIDDKYSKFLLESKAVAKQADRDEKGLGFVRFAKAKLIHGLDVKAGKAIGNPIEYQANLLTEGYATDKAFVAQVAKSLQESNDGGFLIPEEYSEDFIEYLYNQTVVMAMGATLVPMERGNLNINKLLGDLTAQYVAEGGSAAFSDIEIGRIRLSSKKLMCLSAITNDLLRTNAYRADMILRDTLVESMVVAMDYAALYGTGGENQPLGVFNTAGITTDTVSAVPTRVKLAAQIKDLGEANINVNAPTVGWVMDWNSWHNLYTETSSGLFYNQAEMDRGTLLGKKFIVSNQIPSTTTTNLFLGKWNELWIGEEFSIDVSLDGSASFTDTDGNTVNAFTSDFTLFRGITKHDMKVIRGAAFVVYTYNV